MAEWFRVLGFNSSSNPALAISWELFLGSPEFNSLAMFVDSQLVCLRPVEITCYIVLNFFLSRYICFVYASPQTRAFHTYCVVASSYFVQKCAV